VLLSIYTTEPTEYEVVFSNLTFEMFNDAPNLNSVFCLNKGSSTKFESEMLDTEYNLMSEEVLHQFEVKLESVISDLKKENTANISEKSFRL
jgi:hypothetical protein